MQFDVKVTSLDVPSTPPPVIGWCLSWRGTWSEKLSFSNAVSIFSFSFCSTLFSDYNWMTCGTCFRYGASILNIGKLIAIAKFLWQPVLQLLSVCVASYVISWALQWFFAGQCGKLSNGILCISESELPNGWQHMVLVKLLICVGWQFCLNPLGEVKLWNRVLLQFLNPSWNKWLSDQVWSSCDRCRSQMKQ